MSADIIRNSGRSIVTKVLPWAALGMCALLATVPLVVAQTPREASQELATSLKTFLQKLDSGKDTRYVAALRDLNSDGKPEAIVYLLGEDWCGSGGCTTLVLAREGDSWRTITKITNSRAPILVVPRMSHGWKSIGVWVQGGGILKGYEVELRFNSTTYPENPSLLPTKRNLRGRVVVATSQKGERLND